MQRTDSIRRGILVFAFISLAGTAACGEGEALPVSAPDEPAAGDLDRQLRPLMQLRGVHPPDEKGPYDPEVVELGRKLFFDKALSGNEDVACATCHHSTYGANTSDGLALGVGVGGRGEIPDRQTGAGHEFEPRHSIELFNRGLEGWETQFWDARVQKGPNGELVTPPGDKMQEGLIDVIAAQAMLPVTSRVEMRGDKDDANPISRVPDGQVQKIWARLMDRILQYDGYRRLFEQAYPDKQISELKFRDAANAIGQFEKSEFTYLDSPFDRYLRGDDEALTETQKEGAKIFYGKGGCAGCHSGPLTTDQEFHNLAVPQIGPGKGSTKPLDPGRFIVTGRPSQTFAFRTPPLRNVELTPPYMHDGAYQTLKGAIEHHLDPKKALENYDASQLRPAVREQLHNSEEVRQRLLKRLDGRIKARARIQRRSGHPMRITDGDVDRLVAFLESMTSPTAENTLEEELPDSVPSGLLEDGR